MDESRRPSEDTGPTLQSRAAAAAAGNPRQIRLHLTIRELALPPVRDAVLLGRRAPIGPRGLFDALDRMLPGTYELVPVPDHAVIEAAIVRKDRLRLLDRDRLVLLLAEHALPLMDETSMVQIEMESEVLVRLELDT